MADDLKRKREDEEIRRREDEERHRARVAKYKEEMRERRRERNDRRQLGAAKRREEMREVAAKAAYERTIERRRKEFDQNRQRIENPIIKSVLTKARVGHKKMPTTMAEKELTKDMRTITTNDDELTISFKSQDEDELGAITDIIFELEETGTNESEGDVGMVGVSTGGVDDGTIGVEKRISQQDNSHNRRTTIKRY